MLSYIREFHYFFIFSDYFLIIPLFFHFFFTQRVVTRILSRVPHCIMLLQINALTDSELKHYHTKHRQSLRISWNFQKK